MEVMETARAETQESAPYGLSGPRQPDFWHRDHPTFTALAGFFTGLVVVAVIPGLFAGASQLLFDDDTAERIFPWTLLVLLAPLALLLSERTRRFGGYLLIGMLVTAVVVAGVAALVLWVLMTRGA